MTKPASSNPVVPAKPRWGQSRRLAFIDLRLQYDGKINRKDIKDFFHISTPQATADLELYSEMAKGNLRYDFREKAYVAEPNFVPQYGRSHAARYLGDLYRLASGVIDADESFIGIRPPVGVVATPARAIDSTMVAQLVRAIDQGLAFKVIYHSMSEDTPATRVISPHALGFDGLRWHVRAWCHTRELFSDFAIGRLQLEATTSAEVVDPLRDTGWYTMVQLELKPHPQLTPSQREAVMRDYDMHDGVCRVDCRKAMVFYTLRHLNLEHLEDPTCALRQHVILANRADAERWMDEDRHGPRAARVRRAVVETL